MDRTLVLAVMVGLVSQSSALAPQAPTSLIRVYVHTAAAGEATDLAARRESVKDLRAALAEKKKDVVATDTEEASDVSVEVAERSVTIPKVAFGTGLQPGARPGFPGTAGPVREVHLLVKLTWHDTSMIFANKNSAIESGNGWRSAADDIAKQVQKWIVDHRAEILKARSVKVP